MVKSYLIIISLIVIFVVGGIGIFITIPDTVISQKSVEPPACLSQEITEKLLENKAYGMMLSGFDFYTTSKCLAKNFVQDNLDEKYTVIGEITPSILMIEESLPPGFLIMVDLTLKDNTKPSFENIETYRLWVSVHKVSEVKPWVGKQAEIWSEEQGWQETQSPLKEDYQPLDSNFVKANNQFALDFYSQITNDNEKNVFFSPISISTAFAILNEGAKGDTQEEIRNTFGFSNNEQKHRNSFLQLIQKLNKPDSDYTLKMANALWIAENRQLLPEYVNIAKIYFDSEVSNVNFGKKETIETINDWVNEKTEGKIEKLFDSLSSDTVLTITNAIYFKGTWVSQFDKELTRETTFLVDSEKRVKTPMMKMKQTTVQYTSNEQLEILKLPYDGDSLSMLILLPREVDGITSLEESMTLEKLEIWKNSISEKNLAVVLPKFTLETNYDLIPILNNLGINSAFSNADFSGITGSQGFSIDQAVHKAFVDVNEEGTEAAAATGSSIRESLPPGFYATHPFIFIIQDDEIGNILFMGRVIDPTQ